jgi:ribosomal protein S7
MVKPFAFQVNNMSSNLITHKMNLYLETLEYLKNKKILKKYPAKYKILIQFALKCGNKNLMENIFKKGLIFWSKNENFEKNSFIFTIKNAFLNTNAIITVKTKRKGSRNIYIPKKLTKNHSKFLSNSWIIKNAYTKNKNKFFEAVIDELIKSSSNESFSVKNRNDLHKLAEENIVNLKH